MNLDLIRNAFPTVKSYFDLSSVYLTWRLG